MEAVERAEVMASEAEYEARYAAEQEAKYAARYAAEKAGASPASPPLKLGREGFEDTLRKEMQDMPWGERNKYGLALAISRGVEGLKGLIPGMTPSQDVKQASTVASQEAPVGYAVGEFAKYAPALPLGVVPGIAAAAGMGAAYEPGGVAERAEAGATEGAWATGGALAAKGLAATARGIGRMNAVDRARKALQEIVGKEDIPRAAALARAAQGADVTATQAVADMKNPTLAALDDAVRGGNPAITPQIAKDYTDLAARQEASRLQSLGDIAQGSSAESSALARDFFMKKLEMELGPERAMALRQASEAGQLLPGMIAKLGERERMYVSALREGRVPQSVAPGIANTEALAKEFPEGVSGVHPSTEAAQAGARSSDFGIRNSVRAQEWGETADTFKHIAGQRREEADLIRRQIQSLEDEGLKPFTVAPVIDSIERRLASRVTQMNTDKSAILSSVLEKLKMAGNDPHAIAELRSLGVNQLIGDLIQNGKVSKAGAAKALGEVKQGLDKAIIDAGGEGWLTKYMKPYEQGFAEKNALALADELRQMAQDSPQQFLKAVRGDMPELAEKYSATAKSIGEVLGGDRFATVKSVAKEIMRDQSIKELAPKGQGALANVLKQGFLREHLPQFLNRYVVIANAAIKKGEMRVNKKLFENLQQATRDPEKFAELIEMLPPENRSKMLRLINNASKTSAPGLTAAAIGGNEKE